MKKLQNDYTRWGIWLCILGLLCYSGLKYYHLRHMEEFLLIMVAIPFLQLIGFRFLSGQSNKGNHAGDK